MTGRGRRFRLASSLVAFGFLLASPLAGGATTTLAADDGVVTQHVEAGSADLTTYWTGDRIRAAESRDLVVEGETVGAPAIRTPAAAPVGGASWTGGGPILRRSGLVLFSIGGGDYSCTGSVVTDADPAYSLVVTAGHCAYDLETGDFVTNWLYIPDWDQTPDAQDCTETVYGCWAGRALVVHDGWASRNELDDIAVRHDYAMGVVRAGGLAGTTQLDSIGSYPLRIGGFAVGTDAVSFGYPAVEPYDGSDLVYCQGAVVNGPVTGVRGLVCDMTGGASGGPWLWGAPTPSRDCGAISSVNSFRINGANYLFGPVFDAATQKVVDAAIAAHPDASGIDQITVSGTAASVPATAPFTDIGTSTFCRDIEWLFREAITFGCGPTLFCPTTSVTREQMAGFLVRAFDLPSTTTDFFSDDESSSLEDEINAVRQAGITTGCAPGKYCPKDLVTREQMAGFLVRALDLAPTSTPNYFVDDNGRTLEPSINALRKAGITTGCDPTHFCPTTAVSREQMAGFLHRSVGD